MRPIDDGRRGQQNSFASLAETIYTISVDVVPSWAACIIQACQRGVSRSFARLPSGVAPPRHRHG